MDSATEAILMTWEQGQGIPIQETKPTTAFDLLFPCQTRIDVNDAAWYFGDSLNV
jgi:hypothetical protein